MVRHNFQKYPLTSLILRRGAGAKMCSWKNFFNQHAQNTFENRQVRSRETSRWWIEWIKTNKPTLNELMQGNQKFGWGNQNMSCGCPWGNWTQNLISNPEHSYCCVLMCSGYVCGIWSDSQLSVVALKRRQLTSGNTLYTHFQHHHKPQCNEDYI